MNIPENCGFCGGRYNAHHGWCREQDHDASWAHAQIAKSRSVNPAMIMRDLVVAAGREVDEESFQALATYYDEPVGEGVRQMKNGDHVVFVDDRGVEHDALLTAIHGEGTATPSVNVVYVLKENNMHDDYGQQIGRKTSVVHQANQFAQGMYWRKP